MIRREEMLPMLVAECPGLAPAWEEFVREWADERECLPSYIFLSNVATYLGELLHRHRNEELRRAFAVVERWHVEGDSYVKEAATIGLLEDLQNTNLLPSGLRPERFEVFLGPESRRWWTKVQDFWEREN